MIEILVVALLVIWSAFVVFKKVFPKSAYSVFLGLSEACERLGWQGLAKWLKPAAISGCGGSCGCSAAEPKAKVEVQSVKWK